MQTKGKYLIATTVTALNLGPTDDLLVGILINGKKIISFNLVTIDPKYFESIAGEIILPLRAGANVQLVADTNSATDIEV